MRLYCDTLFFEQVNTLIFYIIWYWWPDPFGQLMCANDHLQMNLVFAHNIEFPFRF